MSRLTAKLSALGALPLLCVGLATAAARAAEQVPRVTGVANLNGATAQELHALPGVSTKAAEAIVAYRREHPFTRPEELVKVKGFGRRRFEHLKPWLAVKGTTTLRKLPRKASARPKAHPAPRG